MEFKAISDFSFIDEIHIELLLNPKAPSQYIEEKNYQILLLRLLDIGAQELVDTTYAYIFYDDQVYLVEHGSDVQILENGFEGFIDSLTENFKYIFTILTEITEEIENIEDTLYDKKDFRNFMDMWFQFRKDILKIEKFIFRARLYLNEFSSENKRSLNEFRTQLEDAEHKLTVNIRVAKWYLTKLDALHNYYNSIKNDKLNKNIYLLAIVSGIFLPLNLIVGFFGMNTKGLYFEDVSNGTEQVVILLTGVFLTLFFGLPLVRLLDNIIFGRILGRYNFYKKLSKKIDDLYTE